MHAIRVFHLTHPAAYCGNSKNGTIDTGYQALQDFNLAHPRFESDVNNVTVSWTPRHKLGGKVKGQHTMDFHLEREKGGEERRKRGEEKREVCVCSKPIVQTKK